MVKEIVVISGKGGTGKTSLTAALCSIIPNKIMVDCDVDAADMHLILKPTVEVTNDFFGGKEAQIAEEKCTKCGKCSEVCRFDAVSADFIIDPIKCEGCGVCYHFCPCGTIKFEDKLSGEWYESSTRFGKLVHAKLGVAEENSGKLVTKIRNHARILAQKDGCEYIIVDGSPGIGCPVIASISGASVVLVVTEPTLSGIHDTKRVLELARHFGVKSCVCINKFDLNLQLSQDMEDFCLRNDISVVGKINYSRDFTKAMMQEKTIVEFLPDGEISAEIKEIWRKTGEKL